MTRRSFFALAAAAAGLPALPAVAEKAAAAIAPPRIPWASVPVHWRAYMVWSDFTVQDGETDIVVFREMLPVDMRLSGLTVGIVESVSLDDMADLLKFKIHVGGFDLQVAHAFSAWGVNGYAAQYARPATAAIHPAIALPAGDFELRLTGDAALSRPVPMQMVLSGLIGIPA